jgi:hypothetical protein
MSASATRPGGVGEEVLAWGLCGDNAELAGEGSSGVRQSRVVKGTFDHGGRAWWQIATPLTPRLVHHIGCQLPLRPAVWRLGRRLPSRMSRISWL